MKSVLITSGILIVLVAALRPLLRGRIDPRIQYALWLVVALRLLIPVELATSAFSALALLERAEEPARVVQAIGQTAIPAQSYDSARAQVLSEYQERGVHTADLTPTDLMDIDTRARELTQGPTLAQLFERYARPVWLGGAALAGLWFALVNLRLRRRLRNAVPVELEEPCPLPVFVSETLPSPCLCGTFRPAVYVTPAALDSQNRLRHVLAHELAHYRHKDHWWALVRCLCLCVYWFDPLVWWAAALSRQDCELACDEGAIRRLGEGERIPYGRTLVDMIAAGRTPLLQTATTMTGGRRRVRERIRLIARKPKTVLAVALALVLVLGAAVGCTFTGAPEGGTPMSATADSLQERLLDLPAELKSSVTASASETKAPVNDIALASYWFDVPAEWTDMELWGGYLLSVYQLEVADIETAADMAEQVFAQGNGYYYSVAWCDDGRFEGYPEYWDAVDAVRAFAEKTVLETEGVEPYTPADNRQPLDTLQARLEDIPEELLGDVTLFHPDTPETGGSHDLAFYLLDNPISPEGWEGWLLAVRELNQVGFEDWLYSGGALRTDIFARDGEHYYMVSWPTSVQYGDEDASRYAAASKAIWDYAKEQVLETEGVEPYDPSELREREYLWEGKTYTDVAYWPYKNVNGNTDIVWILRLVQLARDGEGGVWIPERWQCIDTAADPTPQHVRPDEAREMGLTVTQYAQYLQGEADAGRTDWATDPIQACLHYAQTDFAHRNVTADCFTRDAGHIRSALEKLKPSPGQKAVQAAVDRLLAEPSIRLTLAPSGLTSHVYAYSTDPGDDYYISLLADLATEFQWEEAPYSTSSEAGSLQISSEDGNTSLFLSDGSCLMLVRQDGEEAKCYKGLYRYWDQPDYLAYDHLRWWFDHVELETLRAPILSVPDAGQSHEEIARAWAEGYEGVYTKTAPGSQYACTSMKIVNLKADLPDWLESGELEEFARSHGFAAEDFGKTWFGFSYETVFVPVNQSTANGFFVGNTASYEGEDAPEGALTYSRMGFIRLTDEGWTCMGTGTGW